MTTEIKTPPPAPGTPPPGRPPPGPGLPRPRREIRTTMSALGAGLAAALGWTLWQATSSRLSLFVCAATVAAVVVDTVWAVLATKRVEVAVSANPVEAVVGDTLTIGLAVTGPRQFVEIGDPDLPGAAKGVDVPATTGLTGTASRRQVLQSIAIEIRGRGVAGFVLCVRRPVLPLRRPLHVGPRPVPASEHFPELYRTWGEGQARPSPEGDLVRGVRPYTAGDPLRRVHWRATARSQSGDLVVKEVEDTGAPRLHVVLDLGNGGPAAERAAGRAAWYAEEGLRRGYDVILATAERAPADGAGPARPGEPFRSRIVAVTAPVLSPSDVTRRLAAASPPGKPDVPPPEEPGGVVLVSDQGDRWR